MRCYTRLTVTEREEISRYLAAGASGRTIARHLGRHASTISRELRRTGKRRLRTRRHRYRALTAHVAAGRVAQHRRRPRKLTSHPCLRGYVYTRLAQRWSSEQIAKWLVIEYPDDATMRVSHETIYTYFYVLPRGALRRELLRALRHRRKHRQRRKTRTGFRRDTLRLDS